MSNAVNIEICGTAISLTINLHTPKEKSDSVWPLKVFGKDYNYRDFAFFLWGVFNKHDDLRLNLNIFGKLKIRVKYNKRRNLYVRVLNKGNELESMTVCNGYRFFLTKRHDVSHHHSLLSLYFKDSMINDVMTETVFSFVRDILAKTDELAKIYVSEWEDGNAH